MFETWVITLGPRRWASGGRRDGVVPHTVSAGEGHPPLARGALLLATVDGAPAACVGVRPLAPGCCEM